MTRVRADNPGSLSTHPLIGRVVAGTYRIERVLDEGAMGTVFVAEHLRLPRRVAVKVLSKSMTGVGQARARFEAEAEAISRLSHPHIVQILDFDRTETGDAYLVMELLEGESLERRLMAEQRLDLGSALTVTQQIASALSAAHRASVVHRDLKPANVFLVEMPDGSLFVKLLDFGISKRTDIAQGLTAEFDVIGTPDYMCPEQASGATCRVDARGDQYSLAVIVWEMLTGTLPFSGASVSEVLRHVVSSPAPLLSSLHPFLPRELDAVMQRALAKKPEDRFADVVTFANELSWAAERSSVRYSIPLREPPRDGSTKRQRDTLLPLPDEQSLPPRSASPRSLTPRPASRRAPSGRSLPPRSPGSRSPSPRSHTPEPLTPRPFRSDPPPASATVPVGSARIRSSSVPPADLGLLVKEALTRARTALEDGSPARYRAHVEAARRALAASSQTRIEEVLENDAELLETLLASELGSLDVPLELGTGAALNPKEAFLLSRITEGDTASGILDLSAMSRVESLWLLLALVSRGLVKANPGARPSTKNALR
jgi:serine/threonine-protein kinase